MKPVFQRNGKSESSNLKPPNWLLLKVGRGLGDWDVGRVFGTWDAWAGTWGRGDVGTWGRGDVGTWGRGDVGTRGLGRGDVGTWGRGDAQTKTSEMKI